MAATRPTYRQHGTHAFDGPSTGPHKQGKQLVDIIRGHLQSRHAWHGTSRELTQLTSDHAHSHEQMIRKAAADAQRTGGAKKRTPAAPARKGKGKDVLAATDVVHLRRARVPETALCGYRFVEEWWSQDWKPRNYPMCGRCSRLDAAPPAGHRPGRLIVYSGGLPSLGKRY